MRTTRSTSGEPAGTVLMTTDTVGGVWIYALELARSLGERGVRVVLAAMGAEPSSSQQEVAAGVETVHLESRPYKLEWMQDPWDDVRKSGEWLLGLETIHKPDIIHLNGYAHGALPWSAPVLVVGHSCVCSWFHAVRDEPPPDEWGAYRSAVARGLEAADAVTAPTRAMLWEIERHYGAFRSAGVVYNARRTESFHPLGREDFVLTAGRLWDEAKNVSTLDAAARSIDWPVYAAGSVRNPDGGEIRFDALRPLGTLSSSELGGWMGRASIYALPARYEPFGLTALEAAHAGCALVLGDIPTLREIWRDAAVFVRPNDTGALAEAVNALSRDSSRLDDMAARASLRANKFTSERMVTSYLSIYERLRSGEKMGRHDRAPRPIYVSPSSEAVERLIP